MDLPEFLRKKRTFRNSKGTIPFTGIRGNAGFSLIGILVSSGIGLLVIASINQVFIHLATRISQHEDRYKKIHFHAYIVDTLSDPDACLNTLGDPLILDSSNELIVPAIKDNAIPPNTFDLTTAAAKKEMKTKYGIGDFQQLKFTAYDTTAKTAQLTLIAKRLLHKQIPIYEINTIFHLKEVEVSSSKITGCQVIGSSLVGGGDSGATLSDYYNLDDTGGAGKTLIGYDGPTGIAGASTTAVGYKAGGSSSTGTNNTLLGYEAGTVNTSGSDNVLLGYQAGQKNTSGEKNIFIGYQAGEKSSSARENTFMGYDAGEQNLVDKNTAVGYRAGESSYVGEENVFLGFEAGASVNVGSGRNTFAGYQAGSSGGTNDADNVLIGSEASASGDNNIIIRAGTANERELHDQPNPNPCGSPNPPCVFISKNDTLAGYNNILIGSFSLEEGKEHLSGTYSLWIQGLIKGNAKEKWVSIQHDLEAKNLYASLHSSSDKRLKREIKKLERSLETINQLKAYRFKWRSVAEGKKNKNHFGFIAQEVKLLTPEVVTKNRKGFLTVNYTELVPLTVSAFQELQRIVKASFLKVADKLSKARKQVAEQLKIVDLKFQGYIKSVEESITKQLLEIKVEIEAKISEARVAMSGRLVDAEDITEENTKILANLNTQVAGVKQFVQSNQKTIKDLSARRQSGGMIKAFNSHKKELLDAKTRLAQTNQQLQNYKERLKTLEDSLKELL